jgi:hypothetical protein
MATEIRQTLERFEGYADGEDRDMIPFQKYPRFGNLALTADDMLIAYIRKANYRPRAFFKYNRPSFLALCLQKISEGDYDDKDVDIHVGDNKAVGQMKLAIKLNHAKQGAKNVAKDVGVLVEKVKASDFAANVASFNPCTAPKVCDALAQRLGAG